MIINRLSRVTMYMAALLAFSSAVLGNEYPVANVASPDQYQVLHENEHVLVLKMILKPGGSDVMHSHRNETVYFQHGGKLIITEASGEVIEAEIPDGHVMWHKAWSHQVTNSGSTEVVAIIVEDKLARR